MQRVTIAELQVKTVTITIRRVQSVTICRCGNARARALVNSVDAAAGIDCSRNVAHHPRVEHKDLRVITHAHARTHTHIYTHTHTHTHAHTHTHTCRLLLIAKPLAAGAISSTTQRRQVRKDSTTPMQSALHFNVTSTSLQRHFNVTSTSLQRHFNVTLTSLQRQYNYPKA